MSERWRNELRKLRGVEPPDDLRARVDRTSTNEPLPANRQRVIAGVVAFALFAASGAFAWRAFAPSTGGLGGLNADSTSGQALPHGVTFIAQAHGPRAGFSIRMEVDRVEVHGQSSGFSTTVTNKDGTGSTSIGDAAAPEFHAADFVAIPAGTPLLVLGNATELTANATDGASLGGVGQDLDLSSAVMPNLPLGRHLLLIRATWEFGPTEKIDHATTGAGTYFPIEIVPASPSSDGPGGGAPADGVVVVANAQATGNSNDPVRFTIHMRVGGIDVPGASGGYETDITYLGGTGSGLVIGDSGTPDFKLTDYVAVPAGSALVLETNAATLRSSASAGADPFVGSTPVDLTTGVVPNLPLGRHVLVLNATWEFGRTAIFDHARTRAGWSFPIDIVPASPPQGNDIVSPVLRIDCSADPVVATPVVAAARPGIRIRFADRASERRFELRWISPQGSPVVERGPIPGGAAPLDLPIPPGTASVRCDDGAWADVSVVDPLGLWASPVLGCRPTAHLQPIKVGAYPDTHAIRAVLTVRAGDVIRGPDYPGTVFLSMLPGRMVVVRDGETVATLELWGDHIEGEVCANGGIGPRR